MRPIEVEIEGRWVDASCSGFCKSWCVDPFHSRSLAPCLDRSLSRRIRQSRLRPLDCTSTGPAKCLVAPIYLCSQAARVSRSQRKVSTVAERAQQSVVLTDRSVQVIVPVCTTLNSVFTMAHCTIDMTDFHISRPSEVRPFIIQSVEQSTQPTLYHIVVVTTGLCADESWRSAISPSVLTVTRVLRNGLRTRWIHIYGTYPGHCLFPQTMTTLAIALLPIVVALVYSLRSRLVHRTFRNIPGPSTGSFLRGMCLPRCKHNRFRAQPYIGNVHQLIHRHSGSWITYLVNTYGVFSKLSGPFGVSPVVMLQLS